ncbi:MAG: bifunctional adenosylcobinamide kinase/adenosylcobinamide-phosphate guanylyltransferase [Alistipes sp.]|nr:bifunctional adenosylcobinamide kinase/adenosylcobinamide-phosphate guanylyltransferase [Alistipes sp.]
MELYIGAAGQNKLENIILKRDLINCKTADGADCSENELAKASVVDHLHLFVKNHLEELKTEEGQERFLEKLLGGEEKILIGDEIGCGIIPLDAGEREYRELYGRIMCRIAQNARRVTRIICGVHQVIKE